MDIKQITQYTIKIDKLNTERSYGNIMTLISDLNGLCVTVEQLQRTDIIKVLYRVLKTCSDDSVKKTVKSLLSKWKKLYGRSIQTSQCLSILKCSSDECPAGDANSKTVLAQRLSDSATGQNQIRECQGKSVRPTAEEEGFSLLPRVEKSSTKNPSHHSLSQGALPFSTAAGSSTSYNELSAVRSKCVQLLRNTLCSAVPNASELEEKATELAIDIEESIHVLHRSHQARYKACVRSKIANLGNPKSDHLRQGLLNGTLAPEAFARMSMDDMAGMELRRLREEYSSQGVRERQLPRGLEGTPTQKIRCKRCERSDCRVTQVSRGTLFLPVWVQRGGADEDTMTFVKCSGCGEQWYHNGWVCL